MTLVVSVSGDPGFDVQVKDCKAVDTTASNSIQLTDDEGCVLKSKLFGAFQKTRNTEKTGKCRMTQILQADKITVKARVEHILFEVINCSAHILQQ